MKVVSIEEYNKKCDKIIAKHKDMDKCLIALLEYAGKVCISKGAKRNGAKNEKKSHR